MGRDNAGAKEAAGRCVAFTLSRGLADGIAPIGEWAVRTLGLLRRDARQMLVLEDVGSAPHGTALRFTIPAGVEKRGQSNPVQDPAVAGAQALA